MTMVAQIHSLDDLRQFVYHTLCENDKLQIGAFPLTERILMRGQQPCGLYFCLHGPRSHKVWAIWETDNNSVLFYAADGQRFFKAQLTAPPHGR